MFTIPHTNTTNFSANHNGKLLLKNFPTVRLHNNNKYFVTAKHLIVLNKVEIGIAEIKAIRQFSFGKINNNLSLVDAAMDEYKFRGMMVKMYHTGETLINENTQLDHIIYSWVERDIKEQSMMLERYWTRIIEEQKQDAHTQSQLNFLNI